MFISTLGTLFLGLSFKTGLGRSFNSTKQRVAGEDRFIFNSTPKTWADAKAQCETTPGMTLASVHSEQENEQVFKLTGGQTTWLGGNDQTVEGSFQWVDGSAWDWTNWQSGEPNNLAGNEDCVEMRARGEGEWNDNKCANTFPFICAFPYIGPTPPTPTPPTPTSTAPENYCNGTGTHDDWHCCTEEHLCKAGHGDCDDDEGCEGDLVCGNDNCYKIYDHLGGEKYAEHEADCCEIKGAKYWVKVFSHDTAGGLFSSLEDAKKNNPRDNEALLFSTLYHLESMRNNAGKFQLKLCYPELGGCNEWLQSSNPLTESTITGFQSISITFPMSSTGGSFGGLGISPSSSTKTLIDDVPDHSRWYYAVGAIHYWGGVDTIPGPRPYDKGVKKVELFVKY